MSYLQALETRIGWLNWIQSWEGREVWKRIDDHEQSMGVRHESRMTDTLPIFEAMLAQGPTYYMSPAFCQMTDHYRRTVPDNLEFDPAWMMSDRGWMLIAEPFEVAQQIIGPDGRPSEFNREIRVKAVGWQKIPVGTNVRAENDATNGRVSVEGSYHFTCFHDLSNIVEDAYGFASWSYFTFLPGDKLADRMRKFETGAGAGGGRYADMGDRSADDLHEIRWIYTAMWLMSQKISKTAPEPAPRSARRRMEQERIPLAPVVRTVTLRRVEYASPHKKGMPAMIDWQWQWMVNQHGRWQYYPSLGEHKYIIVDSYMKGPADKPVKPPAATVFVARR
jgi:hypothetical protein